MEGKVQSGGQKEGILSKNLYFEEILVKHYISGGGQLPPCPNASNIPVALVVELSTKFEFSGLLRILLGYLRVNSG